MRNKVLLLFAIVCIFMLSSVSLFASDGLPINPEEWQGLITSLVVSFLGSATFFFTVYTFIKKAFNLVKTKLIEDAENGKISRELSQNAIAIVESVEKKILNELAGLKQENGSLRNTVEMLIDRIEQQEAMFAQIIEADYEK